MNKPNNVVEVFMSLVKWFLLVMLVNNIIWLGVVYSLINGSSEETTMAQDGENNVQGINNGTINQN